MKSLVKSLSPLNGSTLKSVAAYTTDEQYLELEFSGKLGGKPVEFTVKIRGRENVEILSSEDLNIEES